MNSRERQYAEWLARQRRISVEEAAAIATAPRPRPYEPKPRWTVERWDNVVPLGQRPASLADRYIAHYSRERSL